MLKVVLHPLHDELRIDTEPVKTLEEALSLIREVFPRAAPAAAWVVWAGDKSRMWRLARRDRPPGQSEAVREPRRLRRAPVGHDQFRHPGEVTSVPGDQNTSKRLSKLAELARRAA